MAVQAGLDTVCLEDGRTMVLTGIDSGDYMKVQGVDFGEEPAAGVEILVRKVSESEEPCVIQVKTDALFADAIRHPHHRPSGFQGKAMPGMLSGGPCSWLADETVKGVFTAPIPPAKCLLKEGVGMGEHFFLNGGLQGFVHRTFRGEVGQISVPPNWRMPQKRPIRP